MFPSVSRNDFNALHGYDTNDIARIIKRKAIASKQGLLRAAKGAGMGDIKIYMHWSAGTYDQVHKDYHINIKGDGTVYCVQNKLLDPYDFTEVRDHTYKRNEGSIGVSLCCCGGDFGKGGLGPYPPTPVQIETMARVCCLLADALEIPIDKNHIMTHGEAGDNEDGIYAHDPYGPKSQHCERADLEWLNDDQFRKAMRNNGVLENGNRGGDILRRKIKYYHDAGFSSHF